MLNPKTTHYEFSGPLGAVSITLGLGVLVNVLLLVCDAESCAIPWSMTPLFHKLLRTPLVSWPAFWVYTAWLATLAVLDRVLPGPHFKGLPLRTGEVLDYKFNGLLLEILLLIAIAARAWQTNLQLPELAFVYEHLLELANVSLLYAVVISTWLYARSFTRDSNGKERLLALGGNTGNTVYDWFIGRELNPRIGSFDLKTWLEMRPGLLLWMVIDLAMLHHQYLAEGRVTNSLLIVTALQTWYVLEGIAYEGGILGMIDIVYDGLGYMLVFGDITIVPFTYSLQARYLSTRPRDLSWPAVFGIAAVYVSGLLVFRLSNNEKNHFKSGDPSTKHLKYITSASGSKLLVSGWWSVARHINYTGDWVMSWAYSLPCGSAVVPYYYIAWFAALLVHRETRDEAKCAAKYGPTWDEYKRRVPYRLIPGVY